jgi:dephospho-CoA kinase
MRFNDFLQEQKEKHAVMAFGRMNPITVGHEKLVNKVQEIAKKVGGSAHIVVSHSQDPKKNPLTSAQKMKHAKRAFPGVNVSASDKDAPNFLAQASKLHKQGVTHFHMVGGSDRADEYKTLLNKYNNVKGPHGHFNFKKIEVHSAGDRDPDAEGVEGMSASKMREHASKGNFKEFRKGVPSKMTDAHAKEMYNHVRQGMGVNESVDEDFETLLIEGVHDKSIFKAVFLAGGPGSGKDYVLDNTLSGHGLTEINSDKALEFLMDKEGLDKTMPSSEQEKRDLVRGRAKSMTELRQRLALLGRNGLIINGTGDDHEKISRIKDRLEEIGYDTSMVMVNTDDEISKQRNIERGTRGGRTVPEEVRKQKWDAVQASRPELAKMFGDKYMEFDNSEDLRQASPEVVKAKKDEMLQLFKNVQQFVTEPPQSEAASLWVAHEMDVNDKLPIPKDGAEMTPHPDSGAAQEARSMGLQYYGFGRYGKNGKVTHRSIHDKLVEVQKGEPEQPNIPVPGTSMKKKTVNEEFEEVFSEDLRNWFSKSHPEGDWKRINSKGEAIGPCAREPGEPKPKCMSRAKRESLTKKERASAVRAKRKHDPNPERKGEPINVSNYGKGKLSESYSLSDSSAMNLLLLGTRINEVDFDTFEEQKEIKLLKDTNGKIRTYMLRRAAAKEAHTMNGTVIPYKNGYVIKLNEENENVQSTNQLSENQTKTGISVSSFRRFNQSGTRESGKLISEGVTELTTGSEYAKGGIEATPTTTQETGSSNQGNKITLAKIRSKQKEVRKESIDKGIEPGLSMASSGENSTRGGITRIKPIKKPLEELTGDETTMSIGAKKEDELKKVGINLQSFKAKKFVG